MKIQLAIDRVSIPEAINIINQAKDSVDIIEIGTSLFKDFGLKALTEIDKHFTHNILADIKTMDEAEYEFRQIYTHGGDIATVMGASSLETIRICQRVAQEFNKEYMIDTMEVSPEKINMLKEFDDAIFCFHLAKDKESNLEEYLKEVLDSYDSNNRIAVAGGVTLEDMARLKKFGVDIAIVGSAITKNSDIKEMARQFKERV